MNRYDSLAPAEAIRLLAGDLDDVETVWSEKITEVRSEVSTLRVETAQGFEKANANSAGNTRWLIATAVGFATTTAALVLNLARA